MISCYTLKWKLHPENLYGWHVHMSILIHRNISTAKKGKKNKPAELMNAAKLIRSELGRLTIWQHKIDVSRCIMKSTLIPLFSI